MPPIYSQPSSSLHTARGRSQHSSIPLPMRRWELSYPPSAPPRSISNRKKPLLTIRCKHCLETLTHRGMSAALLSNPKVGNRNVTWLFGALIELVLYCLFKDRMFSSDVQSPRSEREGNIFPVQGCGCLITVTLCLGWLVANFHSFSS